jgi:hypothetical protein
LVLYSSIVIADVRNHEPEIFPNIAPDFTMVDVQSKEVRASISRGALLGNLEGVSLPGFLTGKKPISRFLSRTRRSLRF